MANSVFGGVDFGSLEAQALLGYPVKQRLRLC